MAYYAVQEGGNYAVYQNSQRVSTTAAGGLVNFGLSPTNLGSATTGSGTTQTQAPTPTPPPQQNTIAPAPPVTNPQTQTQAPPQQGQAQSITQDTAPTVSLQPGQQGTDVAALQNYLIQQGYLTADQVGQGMGTYGPQTTAAVAKLQKDLGVQAGSAAGYFGPQTQKALQAKYQQAYGQLKGSGAPPDQSSMGLQSVQNATQGQQSADPVFGAMFGAMEPIMASLGQVLSNINNPALTAVSLQQEYNDLATQNGLPAMQTQLMNMQTIMNGSEQDIRDEVTAAHGFATDSQVLALTGARNNVILKQYNALATQYQAATTNVQNMMQYAATDQSTQLQRQNMTASITESMASIYQQMVSTGMTMQQNANGNLNKVVTNVGYTGLAAQAQGDPQMLSYYERSLGLAPGALSDTTTLSQLETYRQQQLQMGQQKVQIQMYNAGLGYSPTTTSSPMSSSNPGGYPIGVGTLAVSSGDVINPAAAQSPKDILSATGLSLIQFNYLTQGTSALSRYSQGQRMAINQQVTAWAQSHNVDVSTFQSQYKAYNDVLQSNISRFNNTQVAEGEVAGTLNNLNTASVNAGLSKVNLGNLAKVLGGQQVNDPSANEYSFYFNDLKNSLSYFYAAQQGKSSPDVVDNQDAANVIVGGLSSGGIQGLQKAVTSTTQKMKVVLGEAVDSAQQNVWNLFGVGSQYQSQYAPQNQSYQVTYNGQTYTVDANGDMTPSDSGGIDWSAMQLK